MDKGIRAAEFSRVFNTLDSKQAHLYVLDDMSKTTSKTASLVFYQAASGRHSTAIRCRCLPLALVTAGCARLSLELSCSHVVARGWVIVIVGFRKTVAKQAQVLRDHNGLQEVTSGAII